MTEGTPATERDPLADERDRYDEVDLADQIATGGKVVTTRRIREGEPMSTFALRMEASTLEAVSATARSRGLPTGTLMRQWIVERLDVERNRPSAATDAIWQAALDAVPRLAQDIAKQLGGRRSA